MKKTFKLTHPKIKPDRLIEAVKSDVRKYLKRERNKTLPEGADFWDFDCRFGHTEEDAKEIHVSEFPQLIEATKEQQLESFYVEILVKPARRVKKPVSRDSES